MTTQPLSSPKLKPSSADQSKIEKESSLHEEKIRLDTEVETPFESLSQAKENETDGLPV